MKQCPNCEVCGNETGVATGVGKNKSVRVIFCRVCTWEKWEVAKNDQDKIEPRKVSKVNSMVEN